MHPAVTPPMSRAHLTQLKKIAIGCCVLVTVTALYSLMRIVRNTHFERQLNATTSYNHLFSPRIRQQMANLRLEWISNQCDRIWPPAHAHFHSPEISAEDIAILLRWHRNWTHLSFQESNLSNDDAAQLCVLHSLEYLNISQTKLDGVGLRYFSDAKQLKVLMIACLPVVDDDVEHIIDSHRSIILLDLDKTQVTCKSISVLSGLPQLRGVALSCCELMEPDSIAFARLPSLSFIHLDNRLATESVTSALRRNSPSIVIHVDACSVTSSFAERGLEFESSGPGF